MAGCRANLGARAVQDRRSSAPGGPWLPVDSFHGQGVPATWSPFAPEAVKELKVWESVVKDLRCDGSRTACYSGKPLVTAAGWLFLSCREVARREVPSAHTGRGMARGASLLKESERFPELGKMSHFC